MNSTVSRSIEAENDHAPVSWSTEFRVSRGWTEPPIPESVTILGHPFLTSSSREPQDETSIVPAAYPPAPRLTHHVKSGLLHAVSLAAAAGLGPRPAALRDTA
jgi:hypothetical protein